MTFTFVLAESALELMPRELQREPTVLEEAKKSRVNPDRLLLDASRHLPLMRKHLSDWVKRGRPDIIHFCALLILDSRLNQEHGLRFIVHTRNDEVLEFAPDVRLPRVYNRFCGLMQDLFEKKRIEHEGKPLISLSKKTLSALIDELSKKNEMFALDVTGEKAGVVKLASRLSKKDACFIIGGFPHGSFTEKKVLELNTFSISQKELCAWAVLVDLLGACEIAVDK